ncbi:MAG: hypothetical protein K2Q18_10155, partial [Bdellovibrionales bacterium]|nr:hypothetical protein [Bdellovibrionales bacterium]
FLRYLMALNYFTAGIHKCIDQMATSKNFIDIIIKTQNNSDVNSIFLIQNYLDMFPINIKPLLSLLIIILFLVSSISLVFNYKSRETILALMLFHLLSITIMNLYFMPLIILILLMIILVNETPKRPESIYS